jgi:phage terminase large subunit
MTALRTDCPRAFQPLLPPARYKGAYGGRGSGKSHFFAQLLLEDHIIKPGLRSVCIREVQKDLRHSAKKLIEDKMIELGIGLDQGFDMQRELITTPGDGVIVFQGMQAHNSESIKSLEGFGRVWVEEAQTLSATSLQLLRPTIREADSELWFSWNPRRKNDPVDMMFRGPEPPSDAVSVRVNWDQNPWFPEVLEQERLDTLRSQPAQYPHIWDGHYATILTGAYYADSLILARQQGRIGSVAADPLMEYKAFWDIGTRDATAIWVAQFVGQRINVLDYYEATYQQLGAHLQWLRDRGYGKARCYLPHDGINVDHFSATRFVDHIRQAGFAAEDPMQNTGKFAPQKRIEALRRKFPSIWFNEATCQPGLDALGWYHARIDEKRNYDLGPEHDWASHGADAAGLMALYHQPPEPVIVNTRLRDLQRSIV